MSAAKKPEVNAGAEHDAESKQPSNAANGLRLVRDGTLIGPEGIEIDFRTPDYNVWLTIKAEAGPQGDANAEAVAASLEAAFPFKRIERRNVLRAFEQAIVTGDDYLLLRVRKYLVGQGWIGGAPGQLSIEEAIEAVEQ